jgi:hypothetical protein
MPPGFLSKHCPRNLTVTISFIFLFFALRAFNTWYHLPQSLSKEGKRGLIPSMHSPFQPLILNPYVRNNWSRSILVQPRESNNSKRNYRFVVCSILIRESIQYKSSNKCESKLLLQVANPYMLHTMCWN